MAMIPFGAWEPDKENYQGSTSQFILNAVPRADGYGPFKSFNPYSQPLADGNDSFTKVLLQFDGIDTSTTITDDATAATVAHTWAASGSGQIDTAIYKFGGAALLCPAAGSYVSMADNADLTLSSGAWTIDLQFALAGTSGVLYNIAGQAGTSTAVATSAWFIQRDTSNKISASVSNGSTYTTLVSTSAFTANSTQWHHIEFARSGSSVYLFVDGTLEASSAFSGTVPDSANTIAVGRAGDLSTNTWLGSIDAFRLSVGVARHTAAFTVTGKAYDLATNGICRGQFYARKTDGSVVVFAATSTRLFKLNNTDLSWVDVSKGGLPYTPLTTIQHWQFAQFNNLVIAVQGNTVPQVFNIATDTVFSDLLGSPPAAAYIAVVGRFVVLTGLTAQPFRIQWSGLNDVNSATAWTSGVNSSDFQDFPDGGIVRGVAGGEYGVVFQDSVIRSMIYAVGSAYVFQFVRIAEDKGLLAPYSVIRAGSNILFLAPQGFHVITSSTAAPIPIGKEKVDRYFFANYDQGNLQLIIGASDPEQSRVYWAWKSQAGVVAQFDKLLCFDYNLQRFSLISVSGEFLASLAAPGLTLENLDTISTSIDALTFSLDDVAIAALPKIVAANTSHQLGFFSGSNMEATFDTPELGTTDERTRVRGLDPITDAPVCYGSVGYRETLQSTRSFTAEQAVNPRNRCPANVRTKFALGRLRIPAGQVWTYASGLDPDYRNESGR